MDYLTLKVEDSGKCYAWCPNPQAGREKASKTTQHAKKGKFIADLSPGFCRNQRSGAGSESPEPTLLSKFIGCAQAVGSWLKRIGYLFAK